VAGPESNRPALQAEWPRTQPIEVVGVVGDVHGSSLQKQPGPTVYVPLWQRYRPSLAIAVRTSGDPTAIKGELGRALHLLQPDVPAPTVQTLEHVVDGSILDRRFQLELIVVFAAVALFLAAFGVYGVVAQSVAQRTREIGVRMALGATRRDVWTLVARQGLAPVIVGLLAGLGGALLAGRLVRDLLFGVGTTDPRTFAAVAAVLLVSSVLACFVPARRAASIDPTVALRGE
jgi:putative ABC transport system permease protein